MLNQPLAVSVPVSIAPDFFARFLEYFEEILHETGQPIHLSESSRGVDELPIFAYVDR